MNKTVIMEAIYDTVAQYHGIGKATVLRKLQLGVSLPHASVTDVDNNTEIRDATQFVTICKEYQGIDMSSTRINIERRHPRFNVVHQS
jgi:hypothetical protein